MNINEIHGIMIDKQANENYVAYKPITLSSVVYIPWNELSFIIIIV